LRNHFKTFAIAAMIAMASIGTAQAKSSSFSSRSYSSPSYSSSSRSSSYSSPTYKSPSYSSPSATPSTSKYSSPTYQSSTSAPITASRPIGPAPNAYNYRRPYYGATNVYVHHDSFLTNPFFWLWATDHHNSQPVYVNGGGAPAYGAQAQYAPQYAPTPVSILINWVMFLILVGIIIWAIWFFAFRNKDRY